jgi:hypothetical protein
VQSFAVLNVVYRDKLAVDSNDRAAEYLHEVQPPGLDLNRQCGAALSYISKGSRLGPGL